MAGREKMDWSKIKWLCDGTDNELIHMFLADIDNIGNCDCCPYKTAHPTDGKLPCGQSNCWVEISCGN